MSVKIINGNNTFFGEQITRINVMKESDVVSVSLIVNNCDFELNIREAEDIAIDETSPFIIYHNDNVAMITYLDDYTRKGKNAWVVSTSDSIGRLDSFEFEGDVYFDKPATELLAEIFAKTDVEFVLNADIEGVLVSGRIPYTTCREALAQLLFAVGCFAYTPDILQNENPCVYISVYNNISTFANLEIPKSRVLSGTITSAQQKNTGVEIMSHDYVDDGDMKRVGGIKMPSHKTGEEPYQTTEYVFFENPIVSEGLYVNGSTSSNVEIVTATANFAELRLTSTRNTNNRNGLYAHNYEQSTSLAGKYVKDAVGQIVAIENKTLITDQNIDDALYRCFEYYTKPQELTAKIVEGKHVAEDGTVTYDEAVAVGDIVTVPTDYQGTYTGRIIKEQYNLNGNIIIKEITVK